MSISRIASRYAKSLIQLAVENERLDRVMEDMEGIKRMLGNADFTLMLKSPVVPDYKKAKIVSLLLEGKIDDLTMKFFQLLIQKQREVYLPDIVEEFIKQFKDIRDINTVRVTSAFPLSEQALGAIQNKIREIGLIGDGQIDLLKEVDPAIIGGFILEFRDYIYDASVAQRLTDFKKRHFRENPYKSKIIAR